MVFDPLGGNYHSRCCCAAGLGTSTAKEAKEYFAAMDQHKKNFVWEGEWGGTAAGTTVHQRL
jgi:hypothetical protein